MKPGKKVVFRISLLMSLLFLLSALPLASAQENSSLEVDFFYSLTCPHCASEKVFLESIEGDYPEVVFNYYRTDDKGNTALLNSFYDDHGVPSNMKGLVPITFIGEDYFLGFDESTKGKIEASIQAQMKGESIEKDNGLIAGINPEDYSLLGLAIVLGFIDGFNVCSLAAIMLILSLVLAFKSKKIVLITGSLFLIVTAAVYLVLVMFWHQLFSLLMPWADLMNVAIGILMLAAGVYFFKEFMRFRKQGPTCESTQNKFYIKAVEWFQKKIDEQAEKPNILMLLFAVFVFAIVITIIEFPCSAVLPLIFAGVLAKAELPTLVSVFYILVYILVYLLDEIIVFLVAVFTMNMWSASPKFLKAIYLIASAVLFSMALYYISAVI